MSPIGVLHNNPESHQGNAILYGLWNGGRHPIEVTTMPNLHTEEQTTLETIRILKINLNFVEEHQTQKSAIENLVLREVFTNTKTLGEGKLEANWE